MRGMWAIRVGIEETEKEYAECKKSMWECKKWSGDAANQGEIAREIG